MKCMWCDEDLDFRGGWVHALGGGLYMMRCRDCGHRAALRPSPVVCPKCGSKEGWRDDHIAALDYGKNVIGKRQ